MTIVAWLLIGALPAEDGTPLSLADLPAYRAALSPVAGGPVQNVTFRDLWDHPEALRGRHVRVSGRVARRFRQAPVGAFPALVELWITAGEGDPICVVYPAKGGVPLPEVQSSIRFAGVFLKRLRYRGGDAERLAPLIVGDRAPEPISGRTETWDDPRIGWVLGLGAALLVTAILLARHMSRPPRRPQSFGPPPEWLGPDESETLRTPHAEENP